MVLPLHRAKALAVTIILLTVATVTWFSRDGSDAAAAAAATPHGELTIHDFSGSQNLKSDIRDHSVDVNTPVSSGSPSGHTEFGHFFVKRPISPASPRILRAVARALHYDKVTVKVFKPGTTQTKTTYVLEEVVLVDYGQSGHTENIGVIYDSIDVTHGNKAFCWDLLANAECAT